MKWAKISSLCLTTLALFLSGCATDNGGSIGLNIGPEISSFFDAKSEAVVDEQKLTLDVIIPVFDPGLSEEGSNYEEEGVWPELRRAEANRFAFMLKKAMENTKAFGAVRVTPDHTATGDLYVLGRIIESDGDDVEIEIEVVDISGRHWFTRSFDHDVDSSYYKNFRNKGKDPYTPMFEEAANAVALELDDYESAQFEKFARITEVRFGANMSEDAFSKMLAIKDGVATLISFPSKDDPMLNRTRAVRVRDQIFVDDLQESYRVFNDQMEPSYLIWQEQSLLEIEAERQADLDAAGDIALGVLAVGVAILSAVAGANSNTISGQTLGLTGAVVAGSVGANILQSGFQTSKEAKVHRDSLNELGASIDVDLAPRVIQFEKDTVHLTGNAKEQFSKWREFLKKMYIQEQTPKVQI